MKKNYQYEYPMPAVTADCVVFAIGAEGKLQVLLMKREKGPFANMWALPGSYVRENEGLEECALRALRTKTGVTDVYLEQLYTFGDPKRDPRMRTISIAYYALARPRALQVEPGSLSLDAKYFNVDEVHEMPFDHRKILDAALNRLRGKISYEPVGMELLPEEFTIPQLRVVYEAILGRSQDPGNFRRDILRSGLLTEVKSKAKSTGGRPPVLYRFDKNPGKRVLKLPGRGHSGQ